MANAIRCACKPRSWFCRTCGKQYNNAKYLIRHLLLCHAGCDVSFVANLPGVPDEFLLVGYEEIREQPLKVVKRLKRFNGKHQHRFCYCRKDEFDDGFEKDWNALILNFICDGDNVQRISKILHMPVKAVKARIDFMSKEWDWDWAVS